MLREMPCGKKKVVRYKNPRDEAVKLISRLKEGTWFGFAEVDIEIPQKLWMKFEEMFFFTKRIPDEAVPQHMKDYMARTGRKRGEGKKLVGALSAQKLLLYAPLLKWYVGHGAKITAIYWSRLDWSRLDWSRLDWSRLDLSRLFGEKDFYLFSFVVDSHY